MANIRSPEIILLEPKSLLASLTSLMSHERCHKMPLTQNYKSFIMPNGVLNEIGCPQTLYIQCNIDGV